MRENVRIERLPAVSRTVDLVLAEQLVVWSVRAWVGHFKSKDGGELSPKVARLFTLAGAAPGAWSLDRLLRLIAANARRTLDVRCVRCPTVSRDECLLLHAIAGLHRSRQAAARAVLHDWVNLDAVEIAEEPLSELAASMASASLLVPLRLLPLAGDPRYATGHGQTRCVDPGAHLVH